MRLLLMPMLKPFRLRHCFHCIDADAAIATIGHCIDYYIVIYYLRHLFSAGFAAFAIAASTLLSRQSLAVFHYIIGFIISCHA